MVINHPKPTDARQPSDAHGNAAASPGDYSTLQGAIPVGLGCRVVPRETPGCCSPARSAPRF